MGNISRPRGVGTRHSRSSLPTRLDDHDLTDAIAGGGRVACTTRERGARSPSRAVAQGGPWRRLLPIGPVRPAGELRGTGPTDRGAIPVGVPAERSSPR